MMTVSVSDLLRDKRTLEVAVAGGRLTVTYRPSGLTPAVEAQLREAQDSARSGDVLVEFLEATLVSWDLLDEPDGNVLPVTAETLRTLPLNFLSTLVAAIGEDMAADPLKSGRSDGGAPPKGRSASRRPGTR